MIQAVPSAIRVEPGTCWVGSRWSGAKAFPRPVPWLFSAACLCCAMQFDGALRDVTVSRAFGNSTAE